MSFLEASNMKNPNCSSSRGLDSANETHKGNLTMNNIAQPNESLIPVLEGEIGGVVQPVVNARELHKWLKNGDRFATWMKSRIKKYDFIENEDFICVSEVSETQKTEQSLISEISEIKKTGRGGNRRSLEYILTLDMAKELSMVENNE